MIKSRFFYENALPFLAKDEITANEKNLRDAYLEIIKKTGKGNEFLGWTDLPAQFPGEIISKIQNSSGQLIRQSEVVVVIGIGGSYLGSRAVIEALQHQFNSLLPEKFPTILYAGNSLSENYIHDLLEVLEQKEYSLIVISKSGTTTEPAIAFRILREHCERKYGKEKSKERIIAITDKARGALKELATNEKYTTFDIPDDIGGRYSVLTPVGLLPIAIAGFNIEKLLEGARNMRQYILDNRSFEHNIVLQYALIRYLLYQNKKKIELMVAYEPRLFFFIEWYKQLFGESEGKENKGIFPAGAIFSTDLHSLGQYIQEGERHLFETVISVEKSNHKVPIPFDEANIDHLNYLQKKSIQEINLIAEKGTRMAHVSGGVPNLKISIPEISETTLGELIYFFEFSCAVGGYLLNVNPFDQPGVEAYKQNMFDLLEKPKG